MATLQQIQEIRNRALAKGIPESQVNVYLATRFPSMQQQPATNPDRGNFVTNLVKTAVRPFTDTAKRVGAAGFETKRAYDINQAKQANDVAQLRGLGEKQNPFLSEEQMRPENVLLDTTKSTAGLASYAVPGGSTLGQAAGRGAASGALFGVGTSEEGEEIESLLKGAAGGLVGGAAGYGIGKGLGALKNAVTSRMGGARVGGVKDKTAKEAASSLLDNLSSRYTEATDAGIDLNEVIIKVAKESPSDNLDDLIGPIAAKGRGGVINKLISQAENQIDDVIKTQGDELIPADDVINVLQKAKQATSTRFGDTNKVSAWDDVIQEVAEKWGDGIPKSEALRFVRQANKDYGARVTATTSKEAVKNAANKQIANTLRARLHQDPVIGQALRRQQELIVAQNAFKSMRPREQAVGNELLKSLRSLDISRPATIPDRVIRSKPVASRLTRMGSQQFDEIGQVAQQGQSIPVQRTQNQVIDDLLSQSDEALRELKLAESGALPGQIEQMRQQFAGQLAAQQASRPISQPVQQVAQQQTQQQGSGALRELLGSLLRPQSIGAASGVTTVNTQRPDQVLGISDSSLPQETMASMPSQTATPSSSGFGGLLDPRTIALITILDPQRGEALQKAAALLGGGASGGDLTATQQKDRINALSGLRAVGTIEDELLGDGGIDRATLLAAKLPGSPGARTFETAQREMIDILARMRTGAQITDSEEAFYRKQLPSLFDSPETINYKINIFKQLFTNLADPQSVNPQTEALETLGLY